MISITVLLICLQFYVFHVASGQYCRSIPMMDNSWMAAQQNCIEPMYVKENGVYLQKNMKHCLPCPLHHNGYEASRVQWERDPHKVLVGRFERSRAQGTNCSSKGYGMSSDYSLLINSVASATDNTTFVCRLAEDGSLTLRGEPIVVIDVLDTKFPKGSVHLFNTSELILERGLKHHVMCPLEMTSRSTVYWTLDNGDIIAASFSNGKTLILDYFLNDYNITKDGSLVLQPLKMASIRLWCHVFQGRDKPGMKSRHVNITGKVMPKPGYPYIAGCGTNSNCTIKFNITGSDYRVNCSVIDFYPMVDVVWSTDSRTANVSWTHEVFQVFHTVSETYRKSVELKLETDAATFNGTFTCTVSGSALGFSPASKSVHFIGQRVPNTPTDDGGHTPLVVGVVVLFVVCVACVGLCWFCRKRSKPEESSGNSDSTSTAKDDTSGEQKDLLGEQEQATERSL